MDFIDLKTRLARFRDRLDERVAAVHVHGRYILGPEVAELEEVLADYVGTKHCVGVSSGTDSLLIALMALEVGPGDEVITVSYTWISSAEVIALVGAKPVFVDIDPDTWNMDPAQLKGAITERTKAIIPVGIYGQPPDMDAINEIANRHNIPVIEDAAQSFGATHRDRKSCGLSTIGSTSFFPSKPLGGFGDGGALFTDNDTLAEAFKQIRIHGQVGKHHHPIVGMNGRLDTLQAAMILAAFERFPDEVIKRQQVAACYDVLLAEANLPGAQLPKVAARYTSVYAQYTLLSPERDVLQERLKNKGIPSVAYYAKPLHLQPVFQYLGYVSGDLQVTEEVSQQCLSLPMGPYLTKNQINEIAEAIV